MTTPINETRTKERAKSSNEVFTPEESVQQMLDDIEKYRPELFADPKKTILEPSCGNGRFLTAILERRLQHMFSCLCTEKKFQPTIALRRLYGIDIHASNIVETREAMLNVIRKYAEKCKPGYWCDLSEKRLIKILEKNIICGDSAKIIGDSEYLDNYKFDTPQPDPYAFSMETTIDTPTKKKEVYEQRIKDRENDLNSYETATDFD